MNNGTALHTANDPITVSSADTGNRFQYEAESNNRVYMSFRGEVPEWSTDLPAFGIEIKLRTIDTTPIPPPAPKPVVVPEPEPEPEPEPTPEPPVDPEPEEPPEPVVINEIVEVEVIEYVTVKR